MPRTRPTLQNAVLVVLLLTGAAPSFAGALVPPPSHGIDVQQCEWSPSFFVSGPNGRVTASVVFDDGTGPALYVGGSFSTVDRSPISGVAKWDGTTWSAVGAGLTGDVFALTVFDDGSGPALYAGGNFLHLGEEDASFLARWNGTTWEAIGDLDGGFRTVYALAVFDDGSGPKLAAGGFFQGIDGVAAQSIAAWNGTTWEALGGGTNSSGNVFSFATHGNTLYAAGSFSTIGGEAVSNLAAWDGTTWSAVGDASFNFIDLYSLAIYDDGGGPDLYVASFRPVIGGALADNRVHRWDGASWTAIGADFGDDYPIGLAVLDDGTGPILMVSTYFTSFSLDGLRIVQHLASWDGTTWTDEVEGLSAGVYTMATFDDGSGPRLIVGGVHAEGDEVASVMRREADGSWTPVTGEPGGLGIEDTLRAFAIFDDGAGPALYAAGSFRGAGGLPVYGVARWRDGAWETVGDGLGSRVVFDLAVYDDGSGPALYAAGFFTVGPTGPEQRLARWDGMTWSAITGVGGTVQALEVFDAGGGELLITAGDLTFSSGADDRVGTWDGTTWTPIGTGFDDVVLDLATFDDGSGPAVYAIGDFTNAGGGGAQHVARWDGATWSAAGTGLPDDARVATVYDDGSGARLLVGGSQGSVVGKLTAWDGAAWSPVTLPPGSRSISALDVVDLGDGPALYVGGQHVDLGTYLTRRTAAGWSTLDLGGRGSVQAVARLDDQGITGLLVGGTSLFAGSVVSSRVALTPPCTSSVTFANGFENGSLDAWQVVQ